MRARFKPRRRVAPPSSEDQLSVVELLVVKSEEKGLKLQSLEWLSLILAIFAALMFNLFA